MQIVIHINDKLYDRIKYLEPRADTMLDELMRSVQSGTPLPKGHGRLIDADELYLDIQTDEEMRLGEKNLLWVRERIYDVAPTIIEADMSESEET